MAFSAMRSSLGKVADRLRDNVADVLGDERGRHGSRGGPRGEGLAHNLTLPPLSPQSTSPRTPGDQQQEGDTPPSSREDIAQLLRKLKKRGDVLDRKCTSMREALSLALNCLEDTSSVVEAITGKSLAAFTVPTSTGGGGESTSVIATTGGASKSSSSSSSSNATPLTTGGGGKGGGVAGAAPPPAFHGDPLLDGIGAGAEFMMTEIKSILRKGKAVASKALSPSQPSQPTTTTAPPSAASDREQFSLLPPFPGRKLDAHSLKTALVAASMATAAAAAAAAPGGRGGGGGGGGVMSSILSPPTSKNTQLAAKLTGQAAQISILTAELTTAQAARADAEAALRALSDTLAAASCSSSTAAAPGTTTTTTSSSSSSSSAAASAAAALVEELQGEVAHYRAAVATSGARAEAGELECGRLNALRLSLTASLRASEAAVKEQVGEVERVRREGERAVGEARAREESVKGELERALSRATQAERLAAGNMERLQSDVARLSRELKAAKAAATAASASVASASASATAAEASAATASALASSAAASASTSAAGRTASSAGAGAVSSPTPTPQQFAKACKDLSECKDELEDALTRLSLAGGQEAVLKGEVRSLSARLEALQSLHASGSIPLKYLRAVVMQLGSFCERPWAVSERRSLVNVLATMLDFDEEERRRACVPVLSKKQQVVAHLRMLASPESPSSSSNGSSSSSSKGGGGGGVGSPLNLGGSPSLQQQLQQQQHQGGMEDVPFSPPIQGGGLARAEQNAFRAQPVGQQQQSGGLLGMLGFV